jgi:G3E family GTPase
MIKTIPVTILTGFLGAGKTTLLNHLMQQNTDERVIIIVNELGDENIDHQLVVANENERIYQLNNGCMCCVVREDLLDMFVNILAANHEENLQIDRIFIETSGLAEAGPIVQTVLRTSYLDQQLVVDSVLP